MIDKASIGNEREALEQVMAINEMIFYEPVPLLAF